MADDKRPLKYLRYAIGEIVLVVIGILIALQINNWNEANKQQLKSDNLVLRLEKQISQNIEQTKKRKLYVKNQVEQLTSLMLMIGEPLEVFDPLKLDLMINKALVDHHVGLDLNTLDEAQDNGEIASITNDSLRLALKQINYDYVF